MYKNKNNVETNEDYVAFSFYLKKGVPTTNDL